MVCEVPGCFGSIYRTYQRGGLVAESGSRRAGFSGCNVLFHHSDTGLDLATDAPVRPSSQGDPELVLMDAERRF